MNHNEKEKRAALITSYHTLSFCSFVYDCFSVLTVVKEGSINCPSPPPPSKISVWLVDTGPLLSLSFLSSVFFVCDRCC